jgi:hypothetical protein
MRKLFVFLAATLLAAPGLSQTNPTPPPKPQEDRSDMDKVGDTVEDIAQKPLKDLNIIKVDVDPYLEPLMNDPYSLKGLKSCKDYKAAIGRLTSVLGPDVDSAQAKADPKESPAEFALGAGASVAGGLIPASGLIRKISGAEARQKYANAAVYAGSVRRSYIKGVAKGKNCKI